MTERQEALVQAAGLKPEHVTVTGFAEACIGEPAILTGFFKSNSMAKPTWLRIVEVEVPAGAAVAYLSASPLAVTPDELERERLLAEGDADSGVGQEAVIQMIRSRKPPPEVGEVIEGQAVELPPPVVHDGDDLPRPLPPELADAAGGEGWS